MRLRILPLLAFAFITFAAHADTITLDSAGSSNGTYKYNFSQTNVTNGYESFSSGSKWVFTGLSGVTGASTPYSNYFTASYTSTSVTFTTGGVSIYNTTVPDLFTITSTVLTLGTAQYSIPTSPMSTGSVQGPVAWSAVTPEPSSLILLGTGTLGIGAVLRRRRMLAASLPTG